MLCVDKIKQLGFNCRTLKSGAIEIQTPFQHTDGEPVFVYIKDTENTVITDNGDLMFYLIKSGVDLTHRFRHFGNRAEIFGVHLEPSGEFNAVVHKSLSETFGNYLEFISNFLTHELEALTSENDEDTAIDDVITILKRRNKNLIIERNPEAVGFSKQKHHFDLLAGKTLIDVIKPSSRSTGFVLRKTTDIVKGESEFTPLIIIDDRGDYEKAIQEQAIVSNVARAITYTNLEHGTSPLTTLQ